MGAHVRLELVQRWICDCVSQVVAATAHRVTVRRRCAARHFSQQHTVVRADGHTHTSSGTVDVRRCADCHSPRRACLHFRRFVHRGWWRLYSRALPRHCGPVDPPPPRHGIRPALTTCYEVLQNARSHISGRATRCPCPSLPGASLWAKRRPPYCGTADCHCQVGTTLDTCRALSPHLSGGCYSTRHQRHAISPDSPSLASTSPSARVRAQLHSRPARRWRVTHTHMRMHMRAGVRHRRAGPRVIQRGCGSCRAAVRRASAWRCGCRRSRR